MKTYLSYKGPWQPACSATETTYSRNGPTPEVAWFIKKNERKKAKKMEYPENHSDPHTKVIC